MTDNPGSAKVWGTLDGQVLLSVKSKNGTWVHLEMTAPQADDLADALHREVNRAVKVMDL